MPQTSQAWRARAFTSRAARFMAVETRIGSTLRVVPQLMVF
jgi:hypothetical protein